MQKCGKSADFSRSRSIDPCQIAACLCFNHKMAGRNQTRKSQVVKKETFPHFPVFSLIFSSIFLHSIPQFGSPGGIPGKALASPLLCTYLKG